METGLRVILILIGIAIIAGIIWDFRRNSLKKDKKNRSRESSMLDDDEDMGDLELSLEMPLDIPFQDSYIQPSVIQPAVVKKPVLNKPLNKPISKNQIESPKEPPVSMGEIILLHILARRPQLFYGGKLLEVLNEVHLYYNDEQIFERYENIDGTGNAVFSMVSAVEPGYFELSKMQTLETPGVTLFFSLKAPNQSIAAFELMLRTAKILALRMDGELRDDRHQLLTTDTIERYRDRVRQQQSLAFASPRALEY